MRAGDVVRVDFGLPVGSEAGFSRPAVVVTADLILTGRPRTLQVVPLSSNSERKLPTEIRLTPIEGLGPSTAQAHLATTISRERLIDSGRTTPNVGAVQLAQIRSLIADLLDLP